MRLLKSDTCKVLSASTRIADTFISRAAGLLFSKELKSGEALLIIPCSSIHTMFMRFSIDVVFLDEHLVVKKIINNLGPFKVGTGTAETRCVLELSAGSVVENRLKVGDKLYMDDID